MTPTFIVEVTRDIADTHGKIVFHPGDRLYARQSADFYYYIVWRDVLEIKLSRYNLRRFTVLR